MANIQRVELAFDKKLNGGFDFSRLKSEMTELIEEIIGDMQPPNAADHLMGAISQIIQMKAMKSKAIVKAAQMLADCEVITAERAKTIARELNTTMKLSTIRTLARM